jgi:putative intracellular protease/amidase
MSRTTPSIPRGPVGLRRLARGVCGVGLSGISVAGLGSAGVRQSIRAAYPRLPDVGPRPGRPPSAPVPDPRVAVAVVLGGSGSVITDALGPYEVFARSPNFVVYTVSAGGAVATLSGGLGVVADYSFQDVDAGLAPRPGVVVVPAVLAPTGKKEAPLREWIVEQADRGAHILSVCAGTALLAATGLLDGRRATSHWSKLRGLQRSHPEVLWERGQRYLQDGNVTTTAGVTSGIFGALHLIEQLAGAAEAQRVGRELAYPGWMIDGPVQIRAQRWTPSDFAYGLAAVDVAAPFEVYANSFAADTVPIGTERIISTRHGLRLLVQPANSDAPRVDRLIVSGVRHAGEIEPRLTDWAADRGLAVELPNREDAARDFSFDTMLRDLSHHADRITARVFAKSIEYPADQLSLAGPAWPWRPTMLSALTLALAIGVGCLPAIAGSHRSTGPSARIAPEVQPTAPR